MNARAVAKHFSFLASCVTGYNVTVSVVDDTTFVGYTSMPKLESAKIVLSNSSKLYKGLSEGRKLSMMLGVLAHECLHLLWTDFDTCNRKAIVLGKQFEKDAFYEIHNIIEDASNEYYAPKRIGGKMLKALYAIIKHTWQWSPEIQKDIPQDQYEASAYVQIIRAMIQIGDRGVVKGKFVSNRAKMIFKDVLPLYNLAILESDGAKRVDYTVKIFELLRPLLREQQEQCLQQYDTGKPISLPKGMGEGESSGLQDTEQSESSISSNSNVADESKNEPQNSLSEQQKKLREMLQKALEQSGTFQSPIRPFEASQKDEDDLSDLEKEMEFTDDDLLDLEQDIKQIEAQIQIQDAAESIQKTKAAEDLMCDSADIINHKVEAKNEERYNQIVSLYSSSIATLSNELRKIFMNDRMRTKTSNRGSRVNTKRLVDGKLHSNIMLSRTHPKNLDDMAIYLLIDKSGSMSRLNGRGKQNDQCAAETAICLYEALSKLRIPMYITGFTTRGTKALHSHFVTWHSPSSDKYTLANFAADDCNYDYYSISEATRILKKHPAKHKILIVISDGAPCNTRKNGNSMDGVIATAAAIEQARKTTDVLGVALNCFDKNVYSTMYGKDYIAVSTAQDIFIPISETIQKIVKSW